MDSRRPLARVTSFSLVASLTGLAFLAACDARPDEEEAVSLSESALVAGNALLVVGNATLATGDVALRQRLGTLGLTVTVKTAAATVAADAAGKVVVVSDTVNSGDVNTKLRNVTAPVISLEPAIFDDLGMTGTAASEFGTTGAQTSVVLRGMPGTLVADVVVTTTTAAKTYAWGRPSAAAQTIATINGDAAKATIFAYERGAMMPGLAAPGRRLGWFATGDAPSTFTPSAWNLFDASVKWAAAGLAGTCGSDSSCEPGLVCQGGACVQPCPTAVADTWSPSAPIGYGTAPWRIIWPPADAEAAKPTNATAGQIDFPWDSVILRSPLPGSYIVTFRVAIDPSPDFAVSPSFGTGPFPAIERLGGAYHLGGFAYGNANSFTSYGSWTNQVVDFGYATITLYVKAGAKQLAALETSGSTARGSGFVSPAGFDPASFALLGSNSLTFLGDKPRLHGSVGNIKGCAGLTDAQVDRLYADRKTYP